MEGGGGKAKWWPFILTAYIQNDLEQQQQTVCTSRCLPSLGGQVANALGGCLSENLVQI